jgi:hypothetical protein
LTAIGEIGKTLDNNITKWVRCFYQKSIKSKRFH